MDTPGPALDAGSTGGEMERPGGAHVPRLRGPELTPRDVAIVRWIARHGVVTPQQVAARFFERDDHHLGTWAAYRRLRALEAMRLIRRDRTFWKESQVLRVTEPGARLADVGLGPANLVLAEVHHTLALVDLLEELERANPGSRLVTERELRARRYRERYAGTQSAQGRMPDGAITLQDGRRIAIELDLTPKRARDVEAIVNAYAYEARNFQAIWWYALPGRVGAISEIVSANRADDLIKVLPWSPR